jgi:hypothetical protein
MKAYRGSRGSAPFIPNFRQIHAPPSLTQWKETHWVQGWVGLSIGLEVLKTKSLAPAENGTSDRPCRRLRTTPTILLSQGGDCEVRVFGDVIPSSLTAIFWRHRQAPSLQQKVKAAEATKTLLHIH